MPARTLLAALVLALAPAAAPATAEPCEDFVTECVLREQVDPAICPVLPSVPAQPGVVEVVDGDLYVNGARQWDCPPYGEEG